MTLISRYQKRLSGPLLDRIDIHVEVPRVPFQKLSDERRGETSAAIRARVEAARARQTGRGSPTCTDGQTLGLTATRTWARPRCATSARWTRPAASCSARPCARCNLSARAYHRILKLARTIADLAGASASRPRISRRRSSIGRGGWSEARLCLGTGFLANVQLHITPDRWYTFDMKIYLDTVQLAAPTRQ